MTEYEKEKLDLLIEHNTDRQLAKVDWTELNRDISQRLDEAGNSAIKRKYFIFALRIAAGLAVAAAVVATVLFIKQPSQMPAKSPSAYITTADLVSAENEGGNLIARTDPETILLTGEYHIVSNDVLLKPHSIWAYKPVCCTN